MAKQQIECVTCGNQFIVLYCNLCGEKVTSPKDLKMKVLLSQAFGAVTNLDSKFIRSFRLLLANPANPSLLYVQGKRVRYLKPFQVFLLANVLFFIFLSDFDFLRSPSKWFFSDNYGGFNVNEMVKQIIYNKNLTRAQVAYRYDALSSDLEKVF